MIPVMLISIWALSTLISVWAITYVAVTYEPWSRDVDNGWRVIGRDMRVAARVVQRVGGAVSGTTPTWPAFIMIGFILGVAHTLWLYS